MRHQHRSSGFSLIEMLAATVILGVLITVVLAPLTQLFKSSSKNGRTLQTTTQTQQITEYVRGQWQSYPVIMITNPADTSTQIDQNLTARSDSRTRYDKTCLAPLPLTSGVTTVVVKALDRNADETATLTLSENCGAAATPTSSNPPPPMKRLTVTTVTTAGDRSSLTLDIPRP